MLTFSLADKVAVVTGASRGIGRAIAVAYAGQGADVVIAARDELELAETASQVEAAGGRCLIVPTDVLDPAQLQALADRAVDHFARIDIWVNNAGGAETYIKGGSSRFLDQTYEALNSVVSLNFVSPFMAAQAAARVMIEQRSGVIINITSVTAAYPELHLQSYSVQKAALEQLGPLWAEELGPYNVRVNSIAPGTTRTAATARFIDKPGWLASREASIPLRRLGEPEDIAAAAVYLASDEARHVTGATLLVTGGARNNVARPEVGEPTS